MIQLQDEYDPMKKIGVVIPAWNEESDLPLVLNTVGKVDWLSQVVVVDDGSIDNTLGVAQDCAHNFQNMIVEYLPENQGKGAAMLAGMSRLHPEVDYVLFIDADLIGLTGDHLARLFEPVKTHQCEMSVAIFKEGFWRTDLSQKFAPNLNGQRCLLREAAEKVLAPLAESGYGVEIGLTLYARRHKWRIKYISWEGMTHDIKENKLGWREGFKVRAVMYQQILVTWFREWWQSRREELTALWYIGT
jgi:glycosyltransferase involved in cell wall biosynthesis